MELLGSNSNWSGELPQSSLLSPTSSQTNATALNFHGLSFPNSQSLIQFDTTTGWIEILGNENNNTIKQTITNNGFYQFDIDGSVFSSDRSSTSFWKSLDGATSATVVGLNFDGGLGYDALIVGSQAHNQNLSMISFRSKVKCLANPYS